MQQDRPALARIVGAGLAAVVLAAARDRVVAGAAATAADAGSEFGAAAVADIDLALLAGTAQAQVSDGVVKIGVLTDLSGTYSDLAGKGAVLATKMAIDDFVAAEKPGFKVELVSADHQNKGDIAANKAREWFERDKVDVASELVTTSVALAVQKIAKDKNKIVLMSGPGSTAITNESCNDVSVHWTYDTYALANGTAKAVTQAGGKKWFFLTADYAFGHALEKDASDVVKANGGEVMGAVRHPFPGNDFSSYLLKAQSSGAQVIDLRVGGHAGGKGQRLRPIAGAASVTCGLIGSTGVGAGKRQRLAHVRSRQPTRPAAPCAQPDRSRDGSASRRR